MEEWKQVSEYENYEVSSYGNVRNKKTGRILKPARNGGYLHVSLSSNKIQKSFTQIRFSRSPNMRWIRNI